MSWLRLDDKFIENPKILELSDRALRLHLAALCRCAANLTDGLLTERDVNVCCALIDAKRPHRYIEELVKNGLWVTRKDGGHEIKDYLKYNPDRATVKARQEQRSEAGKAGAEARWGSESHGESVGESNGAGAKPPAQAHTPVPSSGETTRPGEEMSQVHDLDAHAAALELYDAIGLEHRDKGTRTVVVAYALELPAEDFREVRRELVKRRHRIRNEGKWVNGALGRRARKRHAERRDAA